MHVLTRVDGQRQGEPFTKAIARRLKGEFGMRDLSMSEVARRCKITQAKMSRRMTGELPFDIAELEHICNVIGLDRDYILTGARSLPGTDDNGLLLPRQDSNLQPFGEQPSTNLPAAIAG